MDSVIYTRIKELCDRNSISIAKLENELDMSPASISKWKTASSPSVDKLYKIAKYFDVSLDYLVGATDIESRADDALQDEEIISIQRAREKMSERDRKRMMMMLKVGFDYAFNDENLDDLF